MTGATRSIVAQESVCSFTSQQAQIISEGFNGRPCDEVKKRLRVFPQTMTTLKRINILPPQDWRNNDKRIAILEQGNVHGQPRGPAIAINKRVDIDEPEMEPGGEIDWMELFTLGRNRSKKRPHTGRHL